MGQALAKPNTETTISQTGQSESNTSGEKSSLEAGTAGAKNVSSNNKKTASMTKKHESAQPLSIEGGSSSFRLLNELQSDLKNILELLEKHDVRDFRLEKGEERIALKRGQEGGAAYAMPVMSSPAQTYQPSAPAALHAVPNISLASPSGSDQSNAPAPVVVPNKTYKEITSPMVGTFYRRPAVDASPYVEVGDTVKKGDVLCIVEAMKLMNEIEADTSGRVVEICLDDSQMVEYGEVLFRIEPI